MVDHADLEKRARSNLDAGKLRDGLFNLDELAVVDQARAVILYKTYRKKMYDEVGKWADDVIDYSLKHLLISSILFGNGFSEEMNAFEKEHDVEKDISLIPPKLEEAREIIETERKVRPLNLTDRRIDQMEKPDSGVLPLFERHNPQWKSLHHGQKINFNKKADIS